MSELPIYKASEALTAYLAALDLRVKRLEAAKGLTGFQIVTGPDGIEYSTLWSPEYFATYDVTRNAWFDRDTGALVYPMEMAPKELQPLGWTYVTVQPEPAPAPAPAPEPYPSL